MKRYRQVDEDAEFREYYDSYRVTVENLNDTDFLYKTSLSNGQVFFEASETYGLVNNQQAVRGRNITITSDYIDDFTIRDFILFSRASNNLISLDINCNLKNYRDNKPHYLYVVLSHNGTYEVHDDMFQSDETKILFARFIIDNQGNSRQFYMMLPFAGSADYIKGNQFYQVTDGLRVKVVNNSTKQLTLSDAKIRFSGINFENVSSPDCLEVKFEGESVPIRYCNWDSTDGVPRVDWISTLKTSLDATKIMNYSTGNKSSVSNNKFSVQKLYYDVYEKCIISLYGDRVYNSREEAIYGVDSVMNYPLPDGIEYLIPIAAVVIQNTSSDISEDNFRIINLDYDEQEVLDSDTFTRQQAAEAINKSNQALDIANSTSSDLNNHVGDRTNPHRVRLDQLYNSNNQQIVIDNSYADYTVNSILARAAENASNAYYSKNGGTISGNVTIGSQSAARSLTVYGTGTINGALSLGSSLSVKGAITTDSTYNIGTSSSRFGTVYSQAINASGNSTIGGTLSIGGSITPSSSNSYNLGSSASRFNNLYSRYLDVSGASIIGGTLSIGGSITPSSSNSYNLGSSDSRFNYLYSRYINTSGSAVIGGALSTSGNITPSSSGSYNLGSSDNRFSYLYTNYISANNNASIGGTLSVTGATTLSSSLTVSGSTSLSSSLSVSGNTSLSGTLTVTGNTTLNNRLTVSNNGYFVLGGYSLCLGGRTEIPTQTGYGIW